MHKITCKYCGAKMQAQRSNKMYCNSSCRARACEKRKQHAPSNPHPPVRGVIDNTSKNDNQGDQSPNMTNQNAPELIKQLKGELMIIKFVKGELIAKKKGIQNTLTQLTVNTKWMLPAGLMGLGAYAADPKLKDPELMLLGAGVGLIANVTIDSFTSNDDEIAKQNEIGRLRDQLSGINAQLALKDKEISDLEARIQIEQDRIVSTNQKPETVGDPTSQNPTTESSSERSANASKTSDKVVEDSHTKIPITSKKIISSEELRDKKFNKNYFQNEWRYLLGQPEIGFSMVIHGQPGKGKSSFAVQFAQYLAKNLKKVIYISAEEGFSQTMQDKLKLKNLFPPDLHFAYLKSLEEIKEEIKPGTYSFIIIDSISILNLGAATVRDLKEHYHGSSLITICQATKVGNIRGSMELIHDCDIAVEVIEKIAYTTKNRYLETPRKLKVFEQRKDSLFTVVQSRDLNNSI